jgi:hypothetical protein
MRFLEQWLREHLEFADWEGFPCADFFVFLGLAPDVAEAATELEVRWDAGVLKVARAWQDRPDLMDALTAVILSVWGFRRWSDSRWVSLGPCCRTVLAAQCLGLRECVAWVLQQPGASGYLLNGVTLHCTDEVLALVAKIACASWPAGEALGLLLENDRLALLYPRLEAEVLSEVEWLARLQRRSGPS